MFTGCETFEYELQDRDRRVNPAWRIPIDRYIHIYPRITIERP